MAGGRFEGLHSVAGMDLVMSRKIAELEPHMRAVVHTMVLKAVFGHMRAVHVVDYAVADDCNRSEVHRWVDMMTVVRNQSILLGNYPEKNIHNCFPATNINEIPLSCILHIPKTSLVDDH